MNNSIGHQINLHALRGPFNVPPGCRPETPGRRPRSFSQASFFHQFISALLSTPSTICHLRRRANCACHAPWQWTNIYDRGFICAQTRGLHGCFSRRTHIRLLILCMLLITEIIPPFASGSTERGTHLGNVNVVSSLSTKSLTYTSRHRAHTFKIHLDARVLGHSRWMLKKTSPDQLALLPREQSQYLGFYANLDRF